MNARWRLKPHEPERAQALGRAAAISPLTAQLLINRGIDEPARARAFLEARLGELSDPVEIPGVAHAAERIVRAIRDDRRIVVFGDYDVDGVCATSILWTCLRLAGAGDALYYIPHRVDEGYGVNADAIRRLRVENKAAVIVTVDCGISAIREAELARELGVELIITDHHTMGLVLPRADAIVHPRLPGGVAASADLCGAGVAFKLAWQISKSFGDGKRASPRLRNFLVRSLGLVALATIADIVPLSNENRILVRRGLEGINQDPPAGLHALLEVSGALNRRRLTTGVVGFGLAPRINAAGRLERAMMAVELLTTDDRARAGEIARELDRCNSERQVIERNILDEAQAAISAEGGLGDRGAIVLGRREWHPGVIGIVAGRLAEIYQRPTIILSIGDEYGQGSARSIPGFDLHEAIKDCSEDLIAFGGHPAAAGLKILEERLPSFARKFEERCRLSLAANPPERIVMVDAEVPLGVLSLKVVEEIEMLEPHGLDNPRPLLLASDVRIVGQPRAVGGQGKHLQLRLSQGGVVLKAIGWAMAESAQVLREGARCSFIFHASINEWQNRRDIQLEIKDFAVDPDPE